MSAAKAEGVQGSMFQVQCFNQLPFGPVAVGIALAGDPPHGSGRAELPHPALASGVNADVAEE
jgi:hypothetical protein